MAEKPRRNARKMSRSEIEHSMDGNAFVYLAAVPAKNEWAGSNYTFSHATTQGGRHFYRLKMVDMDGTYQYSGIIQVWMANNLEKIVYPVLIADGVLHANLPENARYHALELMDMNGRVVWRTNVTGRSGTVDIPVGKAAAGMYMVRLNGDAIPVVQKIFISN